MIDRGSASAPGQRLGGFFAPVACVRRILLLASFVALGGCADERGEQDWIEATLGAMDLQRQAAQLVASPVSLDTPADYAETAARRQSTLPGGAPGTFWIVSAQPQLLDSLRASFATRPLQPLFAGDLPEPDQMEATDPGWRTGLDFVLAPAGYLPEAEGRSLFARDQTVPIGLRIFDEAAADTTDGALWDTSRLNGRSIAALRSQLERPFPALALPSRPIRLDTTDTLPAFAAADLVTGVIRRDLGWEGLVIADLRPFATEQSLRLGVAAIAAGADLLLTELPVELVTGRLVAAVQQGELDAARVRGSARRVIAAKYLAGQADRNDRELPVITASGSLLDPATPLAVVPADSVQMSASDLADIGEILREGLEDSVFTAASVVVARHGAIAYSQAFGELPDSSAANPDSTLFDLASLSKVVGTTTAAAILIDRGEMELDARVSEYVEEFRGGDKGDVTIRQLLSHTSGLPAGIWLYGGADSEEAAYDRLFQVSLQREPGEAMEYSDLGMILLALAVERVTEMPIDDFLAANLFVPLGMRWTSYLPPASLHNRIVPTAMRSERSYPTQGVVHDGNAFRLNGVAGHAGLFSTASDLAIFAQMIMNGGEYQGRRIVSADLMEQMIQIQEGAGTRALGWDTPADRSSSGRYFSSHSYGHTGFTGTSIWIDPLRDIFVILLTNRTYPDADSGEMFDVRRAVHEAAVLAIDDIDISRRPGSR